MSRRTRSSTGSDSGLSTPRKSHGAITPPARPRRKRRGNSVEEREEQEWGSDLSGSSPQTPPPNAVKVKGIAQHKLELENRQAATGRSRRKRNTLSVVMRDRSKRSTRRRGSEDLPTELDDLMQRFSKYELKRFAYDFFMDEKDWECKLHASLVSDWIYIKKGMDPLEGMHMLDYCFTEQELWDMVVNNTTYLKEFVNYCNTVAAEDAKPTVSSSSKNKTKTKHEANPVSPASTSRARRASNRERAAKSQTTGKSKRASGRSRKVDSDDGDDEEEDEDAKPAPNRGRGRSRKIDDENDDDEEENAKSAPKPAPKRSRGRTLQIVDEDEEVEPAPKRGRGRRHKVSTRQKSIVQNKSEDEDSDDVVEYSRKSRASKKMEKLSDDEKDDEKDDGDDDDVDDFEVKFTRKPSGSRKRQRLSDDDEDYNANEEDSDNEVLMISSDDDGKEADDDDDDEDDKLRFVQNISRKDICFKTSKGKVGSDEEEELEFGDDNVDEDKDKDEEVSHRKRRLRRPMAKHSLSSSSSSSNASSEEEAPAEENDMEKVPKKKAKGTRSRTDIARVRRQLASQSQQSSGEEDDDDDDDDDDGNEERFKDKGLHESAYQFSRNYYRKERLKHIDDEGFGDNEDEDEDDDENHDCDGVDAVTLEDLPKHESHIVWRHRRPGVDIVHCYTFRTLERIAEAKGGWKEPSTFLEPMSAKTTRQLERKFGDRFSSVRDVDPRNMNSGAEILARLNQRHYEQMRQGDLWLCPICYEFCCNDLKSDSSSLDPITVLYGQGDVVGGAAMSFRYKTMLCDHILIHHHIDFPRSDSDIGELLAQYKLRGQDGLVQRYWSHTNQTKANATSWANHYWRENGRSAIFNHIFDMVESGLKFATTFPMKRNIKFSERYWDELTRSLRNMNDFIAGEDEDDDEKEEDEDELDKSKSSSSAAIPLVDDDELDELDALRAKYQEVLSEGDQEEDDELVVTPRKIKKKKFRKALEKSDDSSSSDDTSSSD